MLGECRKKWVLISIENYVIKGMGTVRGFNVLDILDIEHE